MYVAFHLIALDLDRQTTQGPITPRMLVEADKRSTFEALLTWDYMPALNETAFLKHPVK